MAQGFGRASVEYKPSSRFLHQISPLIRQGSLCDSLDGARDSLPVLSSQLYMLV